jgi:hypothetical protein
MFTAKRLCNERKLHPSYLDVNGIWGGYTGEGAKTVIASKAAKNLDAFGS